MKKRKNCQFQFGEDKRKSQAKLKSIYVIAIIIIIATGFILAGKHKSEPNLRDSWIFKENQTGPIIGDLGGIPVSIPKPFAHFVEYMDDPHFMTPRSGSPPKRTYKSRLRSFGFEVRFPDMVPLSAKTFQDYKQSTIHNTMWIDVGVNFSRKQVKNSIQRIANGAKAWKWGNGQYGYKQLKVPLYGLVVYEVYGYDDAKRDSDTGNGALDTNIYYHVDKRGNIENYIKCANVRHAAVSCKHLFTLKYVKKTQVSILYRKALLPQWRQIQTAVEKRILSFVIAKETPQP